MLGFSTAAELRLAVWAVIALTVAGSLLYGNYERERVDAILAKDQAARSAQQARDLVTNQGTISDLNQRLAAALAQPTAPPPSLRLCGPARNVSARPAAPGAQPPVVSAPGTGAAGMPGGTPGLDIGPDVQNALKAARVLAIYRAATWQWAVKQSETKP